MKVLSFAGRTNARRFEADVSRVCDGVAARLALRVSPHMRAPLRRPTRRGKNVQRMR